MNDAVRLVAVAEDDAVAVRIDHGDAVGIVQADDVQAIVGERILQLLQLLRLHQLLGEQGGHAGSGGEEDVDLAVLTHGDVGNPAEQIAIDVDHRLVLQGEDRAGVEDRLRIGGLLAENQLRVLQNVQPSLPGKGYRRNELVLIHEFQLLLGLEGKGCGIKNLLRCAAQAKAQGEEQCNQQTETLFHTFPSNAIFSQLYFPTCRALLSRDKRRKTQKNPGSAWMRLLRVWCVGVRAAHGSAAQRDAAPEGRYWKRRSSSSNFSWVISASAWVPRSRTMCVQRP